MSEWNQHNQRQFPSTVQHRQTERHFEGCCEEALDDGHGKLDAIRRESTLKINPHQADRRTDMEHIEFEPEQDDDERQHNKHLAKELKVRLKDNVTELRRVMDGTLEDRKQCLRERIEWEESIMLCRRTVSRDEKVKEVANRLAIELALLQQQNAQPKSSLHVSLLGHQMGCKMA